MVRLILKFARGALLAMVLLSIFATYFYKVADRIEPMRAFSAHAHDPTPATQRAMDKAFAEDSRIRWRGISISVGILVVSTVGVYAITKRLGARTI